jgi:hypothetical protein
VAATAGIVLRICQHHRSARSLRQAQGTCHRLGGRLGLLHETRFLSRHGGEERVRRGVGAGLAVRESSNRRAAAGKIGIGKAEAERQLHRAQALRQEVPLLHHRLHRRHQRALAAERDPEIQHAECPSPGMPAVDSGE